MYDYLARAPIAAPATAVQSLTKARRGRLTAFVALVALLAQVALPPSAFAQSAPADLDLSSTERTLSATGAGTLAVGDSSRAVDTGDLLTPAEHAALTQVMATGQQSLVLGAGGNAVGGYLNLTGDLSANLASLVVPSNVSLVHDFAYGGALNLAGNLTNAGSIFAVSTSAATSEAVLNAANITNQAGGLLTSVLPAAGLPGFAAATGNLSLTLNAINDIINAGAITSAGALNLNAGGTIINQAQALMASAGNLNLMSATGNLTNSGLVAAAAGNINVAALTASNIAAQLAPDIVIDNAAGTMQALMGEINVRDASFSALADLIIDGGSMLAREINLFSGAGRITCDFDEVSGTVSTYGSYALVGASTGELTLGDIQVTGDPTYFNSAVNGDISITGNINVSERLSIIASRDIKTTAGATLIQARDGSGQGFDINFIAGASITAGTGSTSTIGTTPPVAGNATAAVTIDGASGTGGNIDFTASPNLQINANSTCADCDGANVTVAAYSAAASGGRILLPTQTSTSNLGSRINVSGSGAGNNGNVTLIAGATSGTSITTGKITAAGGTGTAAGTGIISIATAQPAFSSGSSMSFGTDGSITSGNTLVAGASLQSASVNITNNLTASNQVEVNAGLDVNTPHINIATVAVGIKPYSLAVDPGGTFAYVANKDSDSVSVIRTADNTVVATVPVGDDPVRVAVNPSGTFAYVVNRLGNSVSVIDTSNNTVVQTVGVGSNPYDIGLNPAGTFAYIVNNGSNSISVLRTADNTVVATVPAGTNPAVRGIGITPDGAHVYVANLNSNNVSVIRTAGNTVVATVPVGSQPVGVTLDAAGRFAYVANENSDTVSVIRTSDNVVVTTISVGDNPQGVVANPAGGFVYVPNGWSDTVSVIRTSDNTVAATVAVGATPYLPAVDPSGSYVYVPNRNSNTVSIIRASDNVLVSTVAAGSVPIATRAQFVGDNATVFNTNYDGSSVSVIRLPAIVAPAVNLTSVSGAINAGTNAGASSLTASTTGNVTITERDNLGIGASTVGGTFFVGAAGSITTAGAITANTVRFQSTLANGTITVGANLTGTNGTTLTTVGAGSKVLQTGGQIILPNGGLTLNTPQLGDNASAIDITSTQALTFNLPIAGNTVSLATTANNGSITLNRNVSALTSVTLSAHGGGAIATPTAALTRVPVGFYPFGVAVNPAGTFAYVVNYNSGSVSVIDTASNTVTATIAVGGYPYSVAFNPSGTVAYVTNYQGNSVFVVNTAANTVTATVPVGAHPVGVAVSPSGNFAYVANTVGHSVSVINTTTNAVTATIPVGLNPYGIAIDPAGTRVFVVNNSSNSVSVIDTTTNTVVATVPVGSNPQGVAVSKTGAFAYVTSVSSDAVYLIDTASNTVAATLPVGDGPTGVAFNPAGTLAYVANFSASMLSVINAATNSVVTNVPLGAGPISLGNFAGFVGDNVTAYVANFQSHDVSVIRMPAIVASAVNLASGSGAIDVGTNAGTLSASTAGNVTITERDAIDVGASTVGGTFFVGAAGSITTSGAISAGVVKFQSTAGNGTITAGGNVVASRLDFFASGLSLGSGSQLVSDTTIIMRGLSTFSLAGAGTLDAPDDILVRAPQSVTFANGTNWVVTDGGLLLETRSLKGADNGTATLAGPSLTVTAAGDLTVGAVTGGQPTTINMNAAAVQLTGTDMAVEQGTTLATTGSFNISLGSLGEANFTLDGALRQTGSAPLVVAVASGINLHLAGSGSIEQNNAVPAFTAFMSPTQITFEDGLDLTIMSASAMTVASVYVDSPNLGLFGGATATMTTDGGAWSVAPAAGTLGQAIGGTGGTLNFDGGPLYIAAEDINIGAGTTVATDRHLGFVIAAGGTFTNNGTLTATGPGYNGVNQFIIGGGNLELSGTTGAFTPGSQGVAFVANGGSTLALSAGLDWQMTSGGLAYFQASTVEFGAGALFQATNAATVAVSAPAGSDLTVVLPDNATAELRTNGGIIGLVPQPGGSSLNFQNSNNVSLNDATLHLNVVNHPSSIYIGTFSPGATNIAPNVNLQHTGSDIIFFGTVNGLVRGVIEEGLDAGGQCTGGEPSGGDASSGGGEEDEGQGCKDGLRPVAYAHGAAVPLDGMLDERALSADGLLAGRARIEGALAAELAGRGVAAWQEGDAVRLDNGAVLLAPDHGVIVRTPEGDVAVEAGAAAYILATGRTVAVYNLHDEHEGAVRLLIGGEELSVRAGRHVVLTRNQLDSFPSLNPCLKLGYRSLREHRLANGLCVFQGEFSLVSALRAIGGARELLSSARHRQLAGRLVKTAAVQACMRARSGPFAMAR